MGLERDVQLLTHCVSASFHATRHENVSVRSPKLRRLAAPLKLAQKYSKLTYFLRDFLDLRDTRANHYSFEIWPEISHVVRRLWSVRYRRRARAAHVRKLWQQSRCSKKFFSRTRTLVSEELRSFIDFHGSGRAWGELLPNNVWSGNLTDGWVDMNSSETL